MAIHVSESANRAKWNRAARRYNVMAGYGPERRWQPAKTELYSRMRGRVLFLAAGTGLDFRSFPTGASVTAIDISEDMLRHAGRQARKHSGAITLAQASAHDLPFPDAAFDQVFTACTFCSVPDPVVGLREVNRVLRPDGGLHMFEHTGSRWPPFRWMLHIMNPISRIGGPEVIRDTVGNVMKAGFVVVDVRNLFLDVVKTIHARPARSVS